MLNSNVVSKLIGAVVTVEHGDFTIKGKLLDFTESGRAGHKPDILVLENEKGKHIVRSWQLIKVM